MDVLTWGTDPWGQEILIRISWDLLYASFAAGVLFVTAHAIWIKVWVPKRAAALAPHDTAGAEGAPPAANVPARVARHSLAARLFHWVMAAAVLVLLFTGFLPIVGIQFSWITIHWVAGVVLTLSVGYHIIHATFFLDFWSIWIYPSELGDAGRRLKRSLGGVAPPPRKHPKYPLENKLYHYTIMLTGFAVIGTGLVMMVRVETPLWTLNPYLFLDQTWGLIYVTHDLASVGLVALVISHIYFAIRPEKLWITRSMIFGWIDRGHYVEHHDPQRWAVPPQTRKR